MFQNNQMPPQAAPEGAPANTRRRKPSPAAKKAKREWWITKGFPGLFFIIIVIIVIAASTAPMPYVDAIKNIAAFAWSNTGIEALVGVLITVFVAKTFVEYYKNVLIAIAAVLIIIIFASFVANAACEFRYAYEKDKKTEDAPGPAPAPPIYYDLTDWVFEKTITDADVIKDNIIYSVLVDNPPDSRSGPPTWEQLNTGQYPEHSADAHDRLYGGPYGKYTAAMAQYRSGGISVSEWTQAQLAWKAALEEDIIPSALRADAALAESENRRLIAVRYREKGDVLVSLGAYEHGLEAYQLSIQWGVQSLYTSVNEGEGHGKAAQAIDEIISSYNSILDLEGRLDAVDEVVDQINSIIRAYELLRPVCGAAFY